MTTQEILNAIKSHENSVAVDTIRNGEKYVSVIRHENQFVVADGLQYFEVDSDDASDQSIGWENHEVFYSEEAATTEFMKRVENAR